MKLITRQNRANTAAARFKSMVHRLGDSPWIETHTPREIHAKLVALGEHPTPEQVDKVIGSGSWTNITCDSCYTDHLERAVDFDVTGGEYQTLICEACAKKISALF